MGLKDLAGWILKITGKGAGEVTGEITGEVIGRAIYDRIYGWHKNRTETGKKARVSLATTFLNMTTREGYELPIFTAIYDRARIMPGLPTSSGNLPEDSFSRLFEALGDDGLGAFILGLEMLGVNDNVTDEVAKTNPAQFLVRYEKQLRVIDMLYQNHLRQACDIVGYHLLGWLPNAASVVKQAAEEHRAGIEAETRRKNWPAIAKEHELAAKVELEAYLASRKK